MASDPIIPLISLHGFSPDSLWGFNPSIGATFKSTLLKVSVISYSIFKENFEANELISTVHFFYHLNYVFQNVKFVGDCNSD